MYALVLDRVRLILFCDYNYKPILFCAHACVYNKSSFLSEWTFRREKNNLRKVYWWGYKSVRMCVLQ